MQAAHNEELERLRTENARLQAQLNSSATEREQLLKHNNESVQSLQSQNQELQLENSHLAATVEQVEELNRVSSALKTEVRQLTEQLRIALEQQQAIPTAPVLVSEQLIRVRDHILKNWRVAKVPEKKERIKEALDRFIEALDSSPVGND